MQVFSDAKLMLCALNVLDRNIESGPAEVIEGGLDELRRSIELVDPSGLDALDLM